jgi:N-methylhydantoinase A
VLGVASILVPERAGVFSAWGLNLAPLGATVTASLASTDQLGAEVERLNASIEATIGGMNGSGGGAIRRYVEMRYPGQSSTIEVSLDDGGDLQRQFARAHEERFGFKRDDIAAELVGVRVNGTLPPRVPAPAATATEPIEPIGSRPVHVFGGAEEELVVYRQRGEGRLARTPGPFAIERYDSTVLVPPGWVGETSGAFLRVAPQDSK